MAVNLRSRTAFRFFASLARALTILAVPLVYGPTRGLWAQSPTRVLLVSGSGVPGHAGFVFGPFSDLVMNELKEVVFLTTLRSARIELQAVVRSSGVTFSVVAFQGLRSPVPRATYQSFSSPSLNRAGVIAFAAQLKDENPASAVIRVEGEQARVLAASGDTVAEVQGVTFKEFSAPVVSSSGNVLFGARLAGKQGGMGLFLWTQHGIRSLAVPSDLSLAPNDLLRPVYISGDEVLLASQGTPAPTAREQFFRLVAARSLQALNPPPGPADLFEVLPARRDESPAKMLLVSMEGENIQMVAVPADPSLPVQARLRPGTAAKPLGKIFGQTSLAQGDIVLAATAADEPDDLALYCWCQGQLVRLVAPEDVPPLPRNSRESGFVSMSGDSARTVALIVRNAEAGNSTAIYITSLP